MTAYDGDALQGVPGPVTAELIVGQALAEQAAKECLCLYMEDANGDVVINAPCMQHAEGADRG